MAAGLPDAADAAPGRPVRSPRSRAPPRHPHRQFRWNLTGLPSAVSRPPRRSAPQSR